MNMKTSFMNSKTIIASALIFVSSLLFLMLKYPLSDYAYFGGDTWAHQSAAVNFALGHGYKAGKIENFERYKFRENTHWQQYLTNEQLAKEFFTNKPYYFFKSAPGFPLFAACIYKIFGIHPIYIKFFHIIFIAICAALFPIIAHYYWPKYGTSSGALASIIFLLFFSPNPDLIMGESLIVFTLFLWVLVLMFWEATHTSKRTFLLGLATSAVLFIKPYVFLPFFTLLYVASKERSLGGLLKKGILFLLGLSIILAPWSIYASIKSHQPIIIYKNSDMALLDGNNEDSIFLGTFCPGWRKWNKGSNYYLYNRLKDSQLTSFEKLKKFLILYKRHIPLMLLNKLRASYDLNQFKLCLMGMFFYYIVRLKAKIKREAPKESKTPVFPIIFFMVHTINTLLAFGVYRYTFVFMPFLLLPAIYFPFYLFELIGGQNENDE